MGSIATAANAAFRDYVTDGVPASGAYQPSKSAIRALFADIDSKLGQGFISVKDFPYSATGDGSTDDTTAIQACINAAVAAGRAVYIPGGSYKLSAQLYYGGKTVAIFGDGPELTELFWTSAAASTGIQVTLAKIGSYSCNAYIRSMTLSTLKTASGTAIRVVGTTTYDDRVSARSVIRDIIIRGKTNPTVDGWLIGIELDAAPRCIVNTVNFIGKVNGTEPNYSSTYGIRYGNFSSATIQPTEVSVMECFISYTQNALYFSDMEGALVSACQIVGVNNGVTFTAAVSRPHGSVIGTHINASAAAVLVVAMYEVILSGNLFYLQNATADGVGVNVSGSAGYFTINNNIFENYNNSWACNSIVITSGTKGLIAGNLFRRSNSIDASRNGVAIWLTAGATNCIVSNDNLFGVVNTQVLDSGSGNTNLLTSTASGSISYTAPGTGAVAETVAAVLNGLWRSVKSFGAVGDGTTLDHVGINAAILAASTAGGGTVWFPAGTYAINAATASILLKSNVTMRGAGRGATILKITDTTGTSDAITNGGAVITNVTFMDMTFKAAADTASASIGGHILNLYGTSGAVNVSSVVLRNVESLYSRCFGFLIQNATGVHIEGCRVYRSLADGIATWDASGVRIVGNEITQTGDDAISAHSTDSLAAPARSGIVITGNLITEGQGIGVLGAKVLTIAGNIIRRVMAYGIQVEAVPGFNQGDTPAISIAITGNVISDVFKRSETSPLNAKQAYIYIGGSQRQAGSGASVPGYPAVTSGTVTTLYNSNGVGQLYVPNTLTGTVPSAGGFGWTITGNTLTRTLPPITSYSQWGYGSSLWVGTANSGNAWTGAIPEASLQTNGIEITGPLRNSRIADNQFATTGNRCILFSPATINTGDYDGLTIENNQFYDFAEAGVFWGPSSASHHQMTIARNEFNADPRFRTSNRGTGGTWAAYGYPYGLYMPYAASVVIEGNRFRNLAVPYNSGSVNYFARGNLVFGTFASLAGFSTSNVGVGYANPADGEFQLVPEDGDPRSATFGQMTGRAYAMFASAGDTRGTNAVDWQASRNSSSQVASGNYSALVGGQYNALGSPYGVTGGQYNSLTVGTAQVAFGVANLLTGNYSSAPGGLQASDRGRPGAHVLASGCFSTVGDVQATRIVVRRQTTSATELRLTSDGGGQNTTNICNLPNNSVFAVSGRILARNIANNDVSDWEVKFTIKRGANAAATALVGSATVTRLQNDTGAAAWTFAISADTTNGGIAFQAVGAASTTINWVGYIQMAELA